MDPIKNKVSTIKKHISKHIRNYLLVIVIILLAVFILVGLAQQSLVLTVYDITSTDIPEQFNGYRIAHISDFHSGLFNGTSTDVIRLVAEQEPDIICLTGDIVDSKTRDFGSVETLISGLSSIAPLYAVYGNNEYKDPSITKRMDEIYRKHGVQKMDGTLTEIYNGGAYITLAGLTDPDGSSMGFEKELMALKHYHGSESFGIILYHRSNEFIKLINSGYNLVLSGHLHGGVVRVPLIGGILSPEDNLFPKYSGGIYKENGNYLVSNRGIGDNYFIPRIYNPPEVVIVVLHTDK